jgi:inosine-uridine nucleoside N-ribohydrolase
MVDLGEKLGAKGLAVHDALAVAATVDRTLITTRDMRVDIETRGEFTRGETVASRHNSFDRRVERADRFVIVGLETVQPNVHVAIQSDVVRFNQLLLARLKEK